MGSADSMIAEKIIVFGLHGFLGQGSDFDRFKNLWPEYIEFSAPNLFSDNHYDLSNFEICTDQLASQISAMPEKKIFIGYSLGGRIGLHFLEKYPDIFQQYIFLSTHPGFDSDVEKKQRIENDTIWAEKIKKLKWSEFLKDWNSQSVFGGTSETVRNENDYSKDQLMAAMTYLSLAKQKNMNSVIKKNKHKIKWIVGEKDLKFSELAENLKQKKILENYSRISSGHRILFDADISELIKIILQPLAK